jgi:hypothetical protein
LVSFSCAASRPHHPWRGVLRAPATSVGGQSHGLVGEDTCVDGKHGLLGELVKCRDGSEEGVAGTVMLSDLDDSLGEKIIGVDSIHHAGKLRGSAQTGKLTTSAWTYLNGDLVNKVMLRVAFR